MEPFKSRQNPEAIIQEALIDFLKLRDWYVMVTHGNMFQKGFPDLFITHHNKGCRWIDVKNPNAYCFTAAQLETFPKLIAHGSGVWILTAATPDEYMKLFKPCNFWSYLK